MLLQDVRAKYRAAGNQAIRQSPIAHDERTLWS